MRDPRHPPLGVFWSDTARYEQVTCSFSCGHFRMRWVIGDIASANDFGLIDDTWADWSPGSDATEDLPLVKDCLREPKHLGPLLGTVRPHPLQITEQTDTWSAPVPRPTPGLHGTQDGCHGLAQEQVASVVRAGLAVRADRRLTGAHLRCPRRATPAPGGSAVGAARRAERSRRREPSRARRC